MEKQDLQKLKASLEASLEYLKPKRNLLKKGEEAVEAILEKTIEYINEGDIDQSDFGYQTPVEPF